MQPVTALAPHREQRREPLQRSQVCHMFAQTGACKFGAECRFAHAQPSFMANPGKFKRYDISQDDVLEPGANKRAAMEAIELARAARAAASSDGLAKPEEPKQHVLGQKIVFAKRKTHKPSPADPSGPEKGKSEDTKSRLGGERAPAHSTCLATQFLDEEAEDTG